MDSNRDVPIDTIIITQSPYEELWDTMGLDQSTPFVFLLRNESNLNWWYPLLGYSTPIWFDSWCNIANDLFKLLCSFHGGIPVQFDEVQSIKSWVKKEGVSIVPWGQVPTLEGLVIGGEWIMQRMDRIDRDDLESKIGEDYASTFWTSTDRLDFPLDLSWKMFRDIEEYEIIVISKKLTEDSFQDLLNQISPKLSIIRVASFSEWEWVDQ